MNTKFSYKRLVGVFPKHLWRVFCLLDFIYGWGFSSQSWSYLALLSFAVDFYFPGDFGQDARRKMKEEKWSQSYRNQIWGHVCTYMHDTPSAEIKDAIFTSSLLKYSKELIALELNDLNAGSHLCNLIPSWRLEHRYATMLRIVIGHRDPYMGT